MVGTGLGPEVTLNFKVLDVENLYLCAKHQYEIVAKNEGELNKEKFGWILSWILLKKFILHNIIIYSYY